MKQVDEEPLLERFSKLPISFRCRC